MASRFFAIGAWTALIAMAAAATVSTLQQPHLRQGAASGTSHLLAFGSRSAQQSHTAAGAKFDGALADLSRHATPPVLIDAVTRQSAHRARLQPVWTPPGSRLLRRPH